MQDISLFLLMYADDTVFLSETAGGLQKMIDTLHTYSTKWNLCVNTENTNIVVFRNSAKLSFKHEKHQNSTELSKHIWLLKRNKKPFTINWSIASRAQSHNSESKRCNFCLTEKLHILNAEKHSLLNKRPELISKGRPGRPGRGLDRCILPTRLPRGRRNLDQLFLLQLRSSLQLPWRFPLSRWPRRGRHHCRCLPRRLRALSAHHCRDAGRQPEAGSGGSLESTSRLPLKTSQTCRANRLRILGRFSQRKWAK